MVEGTTFLDVNCELSPVCTLAYGAVSSDGPCAARADTLTDGVYSFPRLVAKCFLIDASC